MDYSHIGRTCLEDPSKNYSFQVYIKCNGDVHKENANVTTTRDEPCTYSVLMEVDKGCPLVSVSVVVAFIEKHTPLFSIGFIFLGFALG